MYDGKVSIFTASRYNEMSSVRNNPYEKLPGSIHKCLINVHTLGNESLERLAHYAIFSQTWSSDDVRFGERNRDARKVDFDRWEVRKANFDR
jgi:hypothetical protein